MITATLLLLFYSKKEPITSFDVSPIEKSEIRQDTIHTFTDTVKIKDYFKRMDNIVNRYDSLLTYPVTEHLIVRYNSWVIDSLAATDYYDLKERGITILNVKELAIFKPGDYLVIPDSAAVDSLNKLFEQTWLNINIPEFKLRMRRNNSIIYEFPVRLGSNESKYLAMKN